MGGVRKSRCRASWFVRCVLRMGLERRLGHAAVEVLAQARVIVGFLPGGVPRLALRSKPFSCRSGSRGHTGIGGLCNHGPLPAAVREVPWVALDASLHSSLVRPHTHTILAFECTHVQSCEGGA